MKRYIFLLVMVLCFWDCKAPFRFTDHSASYSRTDSSRVSRTESVRDFDFMRELRIGKNVEIVIQHFALLPDSLRSDKGVTYLVREEHYSEHAVQDLTESGQKYEAEVTNDSTEVSKETDEQKAVENQTKRRGIPFGVVVLVVTVCGVYYLRKKINW